MIGHLRRGGKVILVENQIFINEKFKNRFRQGEQMFPNNFNSINFSLDKVYNAKKMFGIVTLHRKKDRKITFDFLALWVQESCYVPKYFFVITLLQQVFLK